jgi:type I restriction enzyme M protein
MKVTIERRLRAGRVRSNLFTADSLDEDRRRFSNPVENLFEETKREYADDNIFDGDEKINLKFDTVREIVRLLERYNLSDTSEDVKGIAFERFLGRTFRGEIGQFFTPRSIVEFMIRIWWTRRRVKSSATPPAARAASSSASSRSCGKRSSGMWTASTPSSSRR